MNKKAPKTAKTGKIAKTLEKPKAKAKTKPEAATKNYLFPLVNDPTLRKRLELKLKEYEQRIGGKDQPWENMHLRKAHHYPHYRDALYKRDVLEAVLAAKKRSEVTSYALSLKMADKYSEWFDVKVFTNACGVVAMYLGDQTALVLAPGTGLPEFRSIDPKVLEDMEKES